MGLKIFYDKLFAYQHSRKISYFTDFIRPGNLRTKIGPRKEREIDFRDQRNPKLTELWLHQITRHTNKFN
jgi:hypothetical protein